MKEFDISPYMGETLRIARAEAVETATACFIQALLKSMSAEAAQRVRETFVELMTDETEAWVKKTGGETPGDELSQNSEFLVRLFSAVGDRLIGPTPSSAD
jgi:hypothetical protein